MPCVPTESCTGCRRAIYNVADGHQNDDVVGDNTSGISPPVLVAPVRVLLGLPACVTSIAWCPHDASLIAVGGHTDVVQVPRDIQYMHTPGTVCRPLVKGCFNSGDQHCNTVL